MFAAKRRTTCAGLLQASGNFDTANMSCPVLAVMATEDDLLGGQQAALFWSADPEVHNRSLLLSFNASNGGALHDQGGSPIVYGLRSFSFLDTILGGPLQ